MFYHQSNKKKPSELKMPAKLQEEEEEEIGMIETPKVNMMENKRKKKKLQESSEFEEVWD